MLLVVETQTPDVLLRMGGLSSFTLRYCWLIRSEHGERRGYQALGSAKAY